MNFVFFLQGLSEVCNKIYQSFVKRFLRKWIIMGSHFFGAKIKEAREIKRINLIIVIRYKLVYQVFVYV